MTSVSYSWCTMNMQHQGLRPTWLIKCIPFITYFCLISIFEATPLAVEDYGLFGRYDVCRRADIHAFFFVWWSSHSQETELIMRNILHLIIYQKKRRYGILGTPSFTALMFHMCVALLHFETQYHVSVSWKKDKCSDISVEGNRET